MYESLLPFPGDLFAEIERPARDAVEGRSSHQLRPSESTRPP